MSYRTNTVLLSDEVYTYLKLLAKVKCGDTPEANMTADQIGDCMLREKITNTYPQLVELYATLQEAKENAKESYKSIERMMVNALK